MTFLYWFLCILIGLIPAILVYKKDRKSLWKYKWLPVVLRGLSFFIIGMLLLAPPLRWSKNITQKPKIIWLQDNSSSMIKSLDKDKDKFLSNRKKIIDDLDEYEVISYSFGDNTELSSDYKFDQKITNIDQAINTIIQKYKASNLGGIILPTDGIFNEGTNPTYVASNNGIPIYTIGIGDSSEVKDIIVLRTFANKIVMMGNPFEVAVDVKFSKLQNSNHTIQLSNNGNVIQSKNVSITDNKQVISTSFELKANAPGIYKYAVSVPIIEGEHSTINNKLEFFVQVVDNKAKVLILNNGVHPDIGYIRNALKNTVGYEINIASPNSVIDNIADYKTIIAHQPQLTLAQWDKIRAAQIPVWHIMGLQTNAAQIAAASSSIKTSIGGAQYLSPALNNSFTVFKLPLSASSVLGKLPPLESNINTASAIEKGAVLIRSKVDNGDMWIVQSAQNPVAVTIGEGLWRWGIYEYKDNKSNAITQELIQQTVRVLNVPKVDKPFQVYLTKRLLTDNEAINFSAELRNKSGQIVNDAIATLNVIDEKGNKTEHTFDKMGDGYQLTLPKLSEGTYQYIGSVNFQGNNYTDQGTFAVESIPLEALNTQADYALLYQLANSTNGSFHTINDMNNIPALIKKNDQIKSRIITDTRQEPFIEYKWLFGLILLLLTIEWLIRKYFGMQ